MVWLSAQGAYVRVTEIDGKTALILVLDAKLAKQYAGFLLIRKDLGTVRQIVQKLKVTQSFEVDLIIKTTLSFLRLLPIENALLPQMDVEQNWMFRPH